MSLAGYSPYPLDRGAWGDTVHRVTKSQTLLKRLSMVANYWYQKIPDKSLKQQSPRTPLDLRAGAQSKGRRPLQETISITILYFFAVPRGLWDLSSLTSDLTWAPPLDCQATPWALHFFSSSYFSFPLRLPHYREPADELRGRKRGLGKTGWEETSF